MNAYLIAFQAFANAYTIFVQVFAIVYLIASICDFLKNCCYKKEYKAFENQAKVEIKISNDNGIDSVPKDFNLHTEDRFIP